MTLYTADEITPEVKRLALRLLELTINRTEEARNDRSMRHDVSRLCIHHRECRNAVLAAGADAEAAIGILSMTRKLRWLSADGAVDLFSRIVEELIKQPARRREDFTPGHQADALRLLEVCVVRTADAGISNGVASSVEKIVKLYRACEMRSGGDFESELGLLLLTPLHEAGAWNVLARFDEIMRHHRYELTGRFY